MQNRSQLQLIEKINLFFQLDDRKQHFSDGGYCHGLTLLWLYQAKIGQLGWFYQTVDNICKASTLEDFKKFGPDLETFIYHIEWLQNSATYEDGMTQAHMEELVHIKLFDNLSYLFTHDQIKETLIETFNNADLLAISNLEHTMGAYKKGDLFMLYDSNYPTGRHKEFQSIIELKAEMLRRLFRLNALLLRKFPLVFNVFQDNHKMERTHERFTALHKRIIASKKGNMDEAGLQGNTDLLLAAENGNAEEIQLLIAQGANPNQQNGFSFTPLFLATSNNHFAAVKALLENGANVNLPSFEGFVPLMWCACFGLDPILNLLLEHNADPLLAEKDNRSSIALALYKKRFRSALLLLSHIQSINALSSADLTLLQLSIGPLKMEVDRHPEEYTIEQKTRFLTLLEELHKKNATLKQSKTINTELGATIAPSSTTLSC